jgi:hypothetical protein
MLGSSKLDYRFKIHAVKITPRDFMGMNFGRQIEYHRQFDEFKKTAKSTHLSQKRQTRAKAIKEFVELNQVDQFFAAVNPQDHSFEFWYTTTEL